MYVRFRYWLRTIVLGENQSEGVMEWRILRFTDNNLDIIITIIPMWSIGALICQQSGCHLR